MGSSRLVLEDPLLGERAGLDFAEDLLHLGPGLGRDDALPAGQVAVLGRVAHRIAHVRHAALVEEVDDELHLMHALEVGDFGLIPRLDQGVETGLDEFRYAAAENGPARRKGPSRSLL